MGNDKDFWQRDRFDHDTYEKEDRERSDGSIEWQLTEARRDLLQKLSHMDWVDGKSSGAAPWTFVCCHQAGWIERDRRGGVTRYRITDLGLSVLKFGTH